jgi:GDSL-like Lipase/Acylhydrolase family
LIEKLIRPVAQSRTRVDRRHARFFAVAVPLMSLVFVLFAGEVAVRIWHYLRWDIAFLDGQPRNLRNLSSISPDPVLGWRATPQYRFDGTRSTSNGAKYHVKTSQSAEGFRAFGNLASGRPRVFVIGDSFTQAPEDVSDGKTYYDQLKALGMEVFAYGGSGYGSLQEFMILDRYYNLVKPDLIVWQYSTNDLVNNSAELETASRINNNGMVRPYLVGATIRQLLPKSRAMAVQQVAIRYCRVCYILLNRYDRLRASVALDTVEMHTSPGESAYPMFVHAMVVTDTIMGMVRNRVGSVPVVGFIVGSGYPYGPEYVEALTAISRRHNIVLLDIQGAVSAAARGGRDVRAADGAHWSEEGHRVAGEALRHSLEASGVMVRLFHPGAS